MMVVVAVRHLWSCGVVGLCVVLITVPLWAFSLPHATATEPQGRASGAPTTWYVATTGNDANSCTTSADPCRTINAAVGRTTSGDTVRIGAGTFNENIIQINTNLVFAGAGITQTVIDAGGHGSAVGVLLSTVVSITGITLQNGTGSRGGYGGGVYNNGTLHLIDSAVLINQALFAGGDIYNTGVLTLTNTRVATNVANQNGVGAAGGGIYNSGSVTLLDSTISGNTALPNGGGIFNAGLLTVDGSIISGNRVSSGQGDPAGGALYNSGSALVNNSTVSGNSAIAPPNNHAFAGGIYETGVISLTNSTIAGNNGNDVGGIFASGQPHIYIKNSILSDNSPDDCSGVLYTGFALVSGGYNLIEYSGCPFSGDTGTDINGLSAQLGPLQDNGGPTQTMALGPGSPALDGGDPTGCTDAQGVPNLTDQRGYGRPYPAGGRCDIGAFEYGAAASPSGTPATTPTAGVPTAQAPTQTQAPPAPTYTPYPTSTPCPSPTPMASVTPAPSAPTYTAQPTYTPLATLTPYPTLPPLTPGPGTTTSITLTLSPGWNLVDFPLVPAHPLAAQDVLTSIVQSSGGSFAELATWTGTSWTVALDTSGALSGTNFPISTLQGYFLYMDRTTTYVLTGQSASAQSSQAARAHLRRVAGLHGLPPLLKARAVPPPPRVKRGGRH